MGSGTIDLTWFDQLDAHTRDLGRSGQLHVLAYAALDAALSAYPDDGEGGVGAEVVGIRNTFIRTTDAALTAESDLLNDEPAVRNEHNRFEVDTAAPGGQR